MPPLTFDGSHNLGLDIRNRRIELGLTIEDAANKSGVGTKTWYRYESGGAIRRDKVKGVCKTLKWNNIPGNNDSKIIVYELQKYKKYKTWSPYLEVNFGIYAALSFVIGSDILLDEISEGIQMLSEMPRGSHIGELSSFISSIMPEQFLMRYDYEFLWHMRSRLINLRNSAAHVNSMIAHCVIDELILYLIMEESQNLLENININTNSLNEKRTDSEINKFCNEYDDYDNRSSWAYDIFDDMDIVTYLYSDLISLEPDDTYHFNNWFKQQFYISKTEDDPIK